MKILSRDFSIREKILLAILFIILAGMLYFRFIDMPVRSGLEDAEANKQMLESELTVVNAQLDSLQHKQNELDGIEESEDDTYMPSYNNERNVAKLLNDVLTPYGYSITFSNVTRDNNQVRRNISLSFTAPKYEDVEKVLTELTSSEYRCKIGNLSGTVGQGGTYSINTTLTFYETMVGGTPDAGLRN